jgi:hypothetical protein
MAKETTPPMRLAEILSDLVSLRVCVCHLTPHYQQSFFCTNTVQDPAAALALVSARPNPSSSTTTDTNEQKVEEQGSDQDLQRAKDLVELHYAVKEAHKRGELGRGLVEARRAVDGVVGGEG